MMNNKADNLDAVDILEDRIPREILEILLKDRTTEGNIIWATDVYEKKDIPGYGFFDEILYDRITGPDNQLVVRPRVKKSIEEQRYRSKDKAEVFTPAWVCNKQINSIDRKWFGEEPPFNKELESGLEPVTDRIVLQKHKWMEYISLRRIEMACGEAPYIVNRFDVVTGGDHPVPVKERVGILDRKLRLISDNTPDEGTDYNITQWRILALKALSTTYGFEWQGDNLLLAREAVLQTYIDFYHDKWKKFPKISSLRKVAELISWNFWQMDGLSCGIPGYEPKENEQTLFSDAETHNARLRFCRIMNWEQVKPLKGNEIIFKSLSSSIV